MITKKKKREELQYLRDEALDAYMNREDFRYDADGDALYQRYKDSYIRNGQRAMQDTMGQAAALTGGYGSSYAQNVGQQAYQSYLSRMDDVIPELYQLAYERYQAEGDQLYKTYQNWAQQEQQAAQQEQWDREYELAERKRQDSYNRFLRDQQNQQSQTRTTAYQEDPYVVLSDGQNLSERTNSDDAAEPEQDKENDLTGNIKAMQRLLGLPETGKWTELEQQKAGNLSADAAWQDYQQGKLQTRAGSGMSMEKWAELKKEAVPIFRYIQRQRDHDCSAELYCQYGH